MQIIVHVAMFDQLKFPANSMLVIEVMIEIANFDVIPTEFIDEAMHYWPETEPYSVNFESAGTESTYFLANIGFVMYPIYYHVLIALIHACIHKMKNKNKYIGKLHTKIGSYLYWEGFNRFYMEIFLDVAFLAILNLHTVDWGLSFLSVQFSNALSVIFLAVAVGTLVFYAVGYFRQSRELRAEKFGEEFSPLLEGAKFGRSESRWYIILLPVFFFVKRLILIAILIFASHCIWVQIALLNSMALATIIFTLWYMPWESRQDNYLEAFNEATILLLTYHLWSFANIVREPETLYDIGYVFVGATLANILVHLVLMVY